VKLIIFINLLKTNYLEFPKYNQLIEMTGMHVTGTYFDRYPNRMVMNFFSRDWVNILIVLLLSSLLTFWRLGQFPLNEWDESRRGMNALGMIEHHDFINAWYGDYYETWAAKPPLMIWSVVLSYQLFGYNEFALRFPSALCTVLFFIVFYLLIRQYKGPLFSLLSCLILMSVSGIIGYHVGRTGDTDAMLVCLLTVCIFFFLRFVDHHKDYAAYLSAVFLALAFYTKSFAALQVIPGMILFVILRRKLSWLAGRVHSWTSLILCCYLIASWFVILMVYGVQFEKSVVMGHNMLEQMINYDLFWRLTTVPEGESYNLFFIIPVLDITFNIWNYLFYVALILGIWKIFINRKKITEYISLPENQLMLLSCCLCLTIIPLFSLAAFKRTWYYAPLLPFITIITMYGISFFIRRFPVTQYILILLVLLTLGHKFVLQNTFDQGYKGFLDQHRQMLAGAEEITCIGYPPQDVFLYLHWYNRNVHLVNDSKMINTINQGVLVFKERFKELIDQKLVTDPLWCYKELCVGLVIPVHQEDQRLSDAAGLALYSEGITP